MPDLINLAIMITQIFKDYPARLYKILAYYL